MHVQQQWAFEFYQSIFTQMAVLHSLKSEGYQNWTWNSMILTKKLMFSKHQNKMILAIIKFKLLSESDDLSGLIGSISHDDLNSLKDLVSLFDLKITKNASALYTEWFSWPQSPRQPHFVRLIIKNPIFLWYLAPLLWRPAFGTCMRCKGQKSNAHNYWTCLQREINKFFDPTTPQNHLKTDISI